MATDITAESDPGVTFTYNELLSELAAELEVQPRPANSITARELAEATGRTYDWCKKELERRVKNGELEGERFIVGGRRSKVYWRKHD